MSLTGVFIAMFTGFLIVVGTIAILSVFLRYSEGNKEKKDHE